MIKMTSKNKIFVLVITYVNGSGRKNEQDLFASRIQTKKSCNDSNNNEPTIVENVVK